FLHKSGPLTSQIGMGRASHRASALQDVMPIVRATHLPGEYLYGCARPSSSEPWGSTSRPGTQEPMTMTTTRPSSAAGVEGEDRAAPSLRSVRTRSRPSNGD